MGVFFLLFSKLKHHTNRQGQHRKMLARQMVWERAWNVRTDRRWVGGMEKVSCVQCSAL